MAEHKVVFKQHNSKMCLVCGLENEFGLKARFFGLDNGELIAFFSPREEHQSYPGRMHGGIAATILDETIGRAVMSPENQIWGVTLDLAIKLRKPVPLDKELRVIGRITKETKRMFEGSGEILLPNGEVAVEGKGKYLKMPIEKIADFSHKNEEWFIETGRNDPAVVILP